MSRFSPPSPSQGSNRCGSGLEMTAKQSDTHTHTHTHTHTKMDRGRAWHKSGTDPRGCEMAAESVPDLATPLNQPQQENNAITIKHIQRVVDCTGVLSIVCSVQIIYTSSCVCCDVQATALLEKIKKYLCCYCIFVRSEE